MGSVSTRLLSTLVLTLALAACVPSQHDPSLPPVRVAIGAGLDGLTDWRADQRAEIRVELAALGALGPSFVEVPESDPAAIVVRTFDSGPGCARGSGRYTLGTRFVEIDPACCAGFTELRAAVGHELMHAVGCSHVCRTAGEASDCSPVGFGPAVMNPRTAYGDSLDPSDGTTGVAQGTPTQLDLDEFRRTH